MTLRRHGLPTTGVAPTKRCPRCFTYSYAATRTCAACSYQFPKQPKRPLIIRGYHRSD